jgi:hypothetical protein
MHTGVRSRICIKDWEPQRVGTVRPFWKGTRGQDVQGSGFRLAMLTQDHARDIFRYAAEDPEPIWICQQTSGDHQGEEGREGRGQVGTCSLELNVVAKFSRWIESAASTCRRRLINPEANLPKQSPPPEQQQQQQQQRKDYGKGTAAGSLHYRLCVPILCGFLNLQRAGIPVALLRL